MKGGRMSDSQHLILEQSYAHRKRLVDTLQATRTIQSTRVARAFFQVPREAFVPSFYQREAEPGMVWTRCESSETEPEQWLELVYQDEPLVTKLDERKWPVSSSSAPSVMARMLEALDVRPAHRVLEIGTGTGYNAALLASLTTDPTLVTTIEVDTDLAKRAEHILRRLVGPVTVQAKDGCLGEETHAPYDRIIATASVGCIPRAWYEQLAPGGRLVMDLQGNLQASGFLVVEKAADGSTAQGRFWQPSLFFMPLIEPGVPLSSTRSLFQQPCAREILLEAESPFPACFQETAFRWFLQGFYASLTVTQPFRIQGQPSQAVVLTDAPHETILQLRQREEGGWRGKQRGAYPLWDQVQQAYRCFEQWQQPGQERCEVRFEGEQAQLCVSGGERDHPLILRDLFAC